MAPIIGKKLPYSAAVEGTAFGVNADTRRRLRCWRAALGGLATCALRCGALFALALPACEANERSRAIATKSPSDSQVGSATTASAADGAPGADASARAAMDSGAMNVGSVEAGSDASAASSAGGVASAQGWMSYGYDLGNSQYNPHETVLNASNVAGLQETWRVNVTGGATSTPAIYDGKAYFGAWDGQVYAVDVLTAEVSWQRAITNLLVRTSPLVTEERV